MSRPAFLSIKSVHCLATEDRFGADDLFGVLGSVTFSMGSYKADDIRTGFADVVIPTGVCEWTIMENDFPDPSDVLGTIDLTKDLDVERIFGIMTGSARYTIRFTVTGEDGAGASKQCTATCPTCGKTCRTAHSPGTRHWCGEHEWGFN